MTKGQRIKTLREKLKISQVELAEKIDVSKQTLYKYENDIITNIPSDKIEALAFNLKTTPSYLMGWVSDESFNELVLNLLQPDEHQLLSDYNKLNSTGKDKARDYVSDLTVHEKYTKDVGSEDSEPDSWVPKPDKYEFDKEQFEKKISENHFGMAARNGKKKK